MVQNHIGRWAHKKVTEKYDAVVIGAGVSGLGVGGLLAKAGKKVLIVERAHEVGGKGRSFKIEGYTFDTGPHATGEGGHQDVLTDLLGKGDEFRKLKVPFLEGDIRIAYQEGSQWVSLYDILPRGPEALKVSQAIFEMKPEDIPRYDAVSLGDWLKGITTDEKVVDFVYLLSATVLTHADPYNMSAGSYFRIIREMDHDPAKGGLAIQYIKGGFQSWMDLMADACRENGAAIRTNTEVTKILVENGQVQGVLVEEAEAHRHKRIQMHRFGEIGEIKRIEATQVVFTGPIWNLFHMIREDYFPVWFVDFVKQTKGKTTAIVGFWVGSKEPIMKEKWFVLTKSHHTDLPFIVLPLSNLVPEVAPEGHHLLNQISQVELDIVKDREKIYDTIELLKEDMDDFYPGWREKADWIRPYFFDFEESSHMPTQFGVFRLGPKAPKIDGLYFAGETVNSTGATMSGASDSAMICAKEILGTDAL